ncbi:methylmalonyl-CoA mutase [Hyphomicrobium methylovorum]|uniref:methylmalonyl-CoA mutase family protein n=1 Tax=Hyphomicrobium methylovorum TaxID=84 RepID=UPI0015E77A45|nr:methylmalonyl-CoA mutase family protein [Hyphomicrobium methylovorum]MBA2126891.1 methylmalonyl-CoA mutase [Hyphomicrobium methylovorum]
MTSPTPDQTESLLGDDFPAAGIDEWRGLVEKALKGADFEKRLVSKTADGLKIRPLYTRADELAKTVGMLPGERPYTRGQKALRDGLGWDIRSFHVESDPKAANAAILEDLEGGVTSIGLQLANALPPTREALAIALKDVMLDVCPIVLVSGEAFFEGALALNALWDAKGVKPADRQGSFGADPLGALAMQGRLSEPVDTALARAVALMKTVEASPGVQVMTADGVVAHVAGASEAQELAWMLASLVAYLRAAEAGGIKPAKALPKINVALAADIDEFSTIAKLRAARHLIWRVADASGSGDAAESVKLNCPTSYRMMAKRDPWTNILRTTIACTGAALGGADAIVVLPFTFALGKPDSFARRVARNIQIVCQEESHLGRVTDPAGGSWYVENLTDDLAKKAWEIFQDIEARGGMLKCLTSGYLQDTIAATAETRTKSIATLRQELTGVSAFPLLGDDGVQAEPWPAPAKPSAKAAIEVKPMRPHRLGEAFEALRDEADAHGGFQIFLASLGQIADHNIRTTWIRNYLAAGGISSLISEGYKTPEDAAAAFKASGATVACICSSDAVNATLAEPTAAALKAAGAKRVLMAGKPGEKEAALKTAGVDQFLSAGADAVATLRGLQDALR